MKNPKSGGSRGASGYGLKFCPECRRVWEHIGRKRFNYYEDFPAIGKPRRECPECISQITAKDSENGAAA